MTNEVSYPLEDIRAKIYTIRGVQVMLDSDLAHLYQVETRVLNQAVKRNIDGYVDRNTLAMLTGKKANVSVTIYTSKKNCRITEQESKSFNSQYGPLDIKFTDEFHDRFLLLDEKELYHVGASIKDAGKKAFEISLNEDPKILDAVLQRL